jgi:hypothetical protein
MPATEVIRIRKYAYALELPADAATVYVFSVPSAKAVDV